MLSVRKRVFDYLEKNGSDFGYRKQRELSRVLAESLNANHDSVRKYIRQWIKINSEREKAIEDTCEDLDLSVSDVKHGWIKKDGASLFFKNPDFGEGLTFEDLAKDLLEDIQNHAPRYPEIKRHGYSESNLLVLDPADVHIGKLCSSFETGEDYDSQIAVNRVNDGVDGILNKSYGHNIDQIVFIGGNDILHIDTPHRKTTSGTPQDTDGMWYENFLTAKRLYVDVIERLLSVSDVHFMYNPSNHDYMSGFFLADVIKTHFKDCKHITFDTSIAHRKYYKYHKNAIGSTHGDGAKIQDLPLLMAQESKIWDITEHRYMYIHHIHHKHSKDYAGVTVESLRSPSGTDSWHHRNGYQHSPKAIEGFIHHKEHGQISRLTHIF